MNALTFSDVAVPVLVIGLAVASSVGSRRLGRKHLLLLILGGAIATALAVAATPGPYEPHRHAFEQNLVVAAVPFGIAVLISGLSAMLTRSWPIVAQVASVLAVWYVAWVVAVYGVLVVLVPD